MIDNFAKQPQVLAGLERVLNETFGPIRGLVEVTTITGGEVTSMSIQRGNRSLIARLEGSESDALRIIDVDEFLDLGEEYLITLDQLKSKVDHEW